ncbi:serine/arginine repetitive matrix protein 3 isoform X2 [Nothobranchius furzeri]|uniref:serine/arginine repetitive matrix protein 3 isoform X2 n=1 Tax=Nothobranchius furzeri TaxID=105023 RepID=UPI00390476C2
MYDATRVPSPKDGASDVVQPVVPGPESGTAPGPSGPTSTVLLQAKGEDGQPGMEEEELKVEPVLVKKPHREILDHERKRRVELKCMELQEMMEEQGYTEEEIRQKVSTFRQMLMDKEGVITREDSHTQANHIHYQPYECEVEAGADGYEEGDDDYHSDRMKRKSSSSLSPRPKKRKKKKSGRRRTRFVSSSPTCGDKKKKGGKKHKRGRSGSNSRKKRSYRSGSPKNKHKDKSRQKQRSPGEIPSKSSHHQGSCCSSRSASLSSTRSTSKSPTRLKSKHKAEGQKVSRTSPAPSNPAAWHNGDHTQRSRNGNPGRLVHSEGDKGNDRLHLLNVSSAGLQSTLLRDHKLHSIPGRNQTGLVCTAGEAGSVDGKLSAVGSSLTQTSGRRGAQRGQRRSSRSPAQSSDSAHSQQNHTNRARSSRHQKKSKGGHSKRHHRSGRGPARHRNQSGSPGHHAHTSGRKSEEPRSKADLRQRSSSWSSGHSSSHSASRDRGPSKVKSPHSRQNVSRERDSANRSDTDSRARRRSRSYSPIRKRRRDSPSFMEARRITSPKGPHAETTGCCRLITMVTVAVQQDSADLTPEAQLNHQSSSE